MSAFPDFPYDGNGHFRGAGGIVIDLYRQQIGTVPRFDREQEAELARRTQQGDRDAREQLILSQLPMVLHLARKLNAPMAVWDDLVQAGNVSLIIAVDKFDENRGCRLCSFAFPVIRRGMWAMLRKSPRFVPLDDVGERLPAVTDADDQKREWLRGALGQLNQIQQNVLGRKLDGQSVAEIGRALRLTSGDVQGVQAKAVRRLKSAAVA